MTFDSWAMMFAIAFHAVLFHAMPRFSRPDILFAVTVPQAFASGEGRVLVSRYRAVIWSSAAVALALAALLPSAPLSPDRRGFLIMAVVAGNLIVGFSAWLWANRKARMHAVPHSEVRVASLVPRDTSLPGGALFACGPFTILLAAGVLLYAFGNQGPDASRPVRPFGTLAMGGLYATMMLIMAVSLSRRTRQIAIDGMAAEAEQRFRRVNVFMIVLAGYGMAMMLSAATLDSIPAFRDALRGRFGFVMLPMMVVSFGVAVWMFRVGQGGQRAVAATARHGTRGDATPDEAWKIGGLFYYNPKDPAIWVEKRIGLGYTLNVGNSGAWLLMGMMLLPMVAAPLLF